MTLPQADIVFAGSGTKFPAQFGALKRFKEQYSIRRSVGTSGGSLPATIGAMGFDEEEAQDLILELLSDTKSLLDYRLWPFGRNKPIIGEGKGFIKGNRIEKKLDEILAAQHGSSPTFSDYPNLYITVVDSSTYKARLLNAKTDPDVKISTGIRASIAIPGLFMNKKINGVRYIDGGVLWNFPIDAFGPVDRIFGIYFPDQITTLEYKNSAEYYGNIFDGLMAQIARLNMRLAPAGTAYCPIKLKETGLNFNLNREQIQEMIDIGYEAADLNIHKLGRL